MKKDVAITGAFQKFFHESNHKPNKGSEFYNKLLKSWL